MASRITQFDRENVNDIMNGHGDWMAAQILRLLCKADAETAEQFRLGFPEHVALYEQWKAGR